LNKSAFSHNPSVDVSSVFEGLRVRKFWVAAKKIGTLSALLDIYCVKISALYVQSFWSYSQKKWKLGLICQKNCRIKTKEPRTCAMNPNQRIRHLWSRTQFD